MSPSNGIPLRTRVQNHKTLLQEAVKKPGGFAPKVMTGKQLLLIEHQARDAPNVSVYSRLRDWAKNTVPHQITHLKACVQPDIDPVSIMRATKIPY
jgi:hypothetical protein